MKKSILLFLTGLMLTAAMALAEPQLSGVFADDVTLTAGEDGWFVEFIASENGMMAMELLSGETGEKVADLGAVQVEAGAGRVDWNGLLPDGSAVPAGYYMVGMQMRGETGEESAEYLISVEVLGGKGEPEALDLSALDVQEAVLSGEQMGGAQEEEERAVPVATSFWDMDPDAYDLTNPEHQQAIWDIMMQPITVIQGDQTENVYITNQPGINARPYKDNCAGELHGQSQGVRIVEDDAAIMLFKNVV